MSDDEEPTTRELFNITAAIMMLIVAAYWASQLWNN